MNVIARLGFELTYYDSAVHHFNHYATRKPPEKTLSWFKILSFYRSKVTNKLVKVYLLPSFMLNGNEGQIA